VVSDHTTHENIQLRIRLEAALSIKDDFFAINIITDKSTFIKMGVTSSTHDAIARHADHLRKFATLSYADFLASVEHLNLVAEQHVDPNGKRLMFAIRPKSSDSLVWKATAKVDCYKVNCRSCQIETTRVLTLHQFIALYDQIIKHVDSASVNPEVASGSARPSLAIDDSSSTLEASALLAEFDALGGSTANGALDSVDNVIECCICMERKSSIILPCLHTYCEKCIDSWWESGGEEAQTCPLCRQELKDKGDQWVLMSERPDAQEMEHEVSSCMVGLASNAGRPQDPEEDPG